MISAESGTSFVERAYELGVSDYISRPFDALIVRRRVVNTLMLYAKQKLMPEAARSGAQSAVCPFCVPCRKSLR